MYQALYLMPTRRCNCRCGYCYLEDKQEPRGEDDTLLASVLERFIEGVRSARSNGAVPQLRFIGGEPYLRLDLVQRLSLRFTASFSNAMVLINSNGTLVANADLEPLQPYRRRLYHVLSLDGPKPIHDARRRTVDGEGTYDAVIAGIERLRRRRFPVYVNTVLDRQSVEGLEALMRLLKDDFGLDSLSVSLRKPTRSPLPGDNPFALLCRAYELAERVQVRLSGHHRLLLGHRNPQLRCRAGERSILVTGDGSVSACQRFLGREDGSCALGPRPDLCRWPRRALTTASVCYTPERLRLGDRLYALYQQRYPHYLQVQPLDRILYGTIG